MVNQTSASISQGALARDQSAIGSIGLSEIISALSLALDLTEGAVRGHALRSCLLGMRLAGELHLSTSEQQDLYYALLLKDVGCSSNAARMCQIVGGDDIAVKSEVKLEDWTVMKPRLSNLKMLWHHVLPGEDAAYRVARILKLGLTQNRNNEQLITMRCDRGASIVRKLGLGEDVADGVRFLDEHWDGSGYPERRMGSSIPLASRIMLVAQNLDVFASERSVAEALRVLDERSEKWFDPELVRIANALHRKGQLWPYCGPGAQLDETRSAVLDIDPGQQVSLGAGGIDNICEAFAEVVDAKSPFTFRHSKGVAVAAVGIARGMGLGSDRVKLVRRAALLHDIGKLNVPNTILDKQGRLDQQEWLTVREHPAMSRLILGKVSAFQEIALVAGEHHERLDGSGYPNALEGHSLSLEARILAVADVYGALSENRPYREGLSLNEIRSIMGKDIPGQLHGPAFDALLGYLGEETKLKVPSLAPSAVSEAVVLP